MSHSNPYAPSSLLLPSSPLSQVGMEMRRAIIEGLNTSTAYYFHIKLTRDAKHKVIAMMLGLCRN